MTIVLSTAKPELSFVMITRYPPKIELTSNVAASDPVGSVTCVKLVSPAVTVVNAKGEPLNDVETLI